VIKCSNQQQTVGIIVFAYPYGAGKSLFGSGTQVSFELQPLFDVAVMKELTDDLCSVNMPQAQKYTWKIKYTLGGGEIHGEQV